MYMEVQFPREKQIAEVSAPGRIFLLAYVGDEPAGFASLRISEPPKGLEGTNSIEIVQCYAEQKMIGKGVGPALMERCIEIAREQGRDWVWLGVWERNYRAQAFYTKYGFERFEDHPFILGLDIQTDWWMRKKL